jgi:hypothetical protein
MTFQDVAFIGPLTMADLTTDADNISGVIFGSSTTYPTENITFASCEFMGTTYGLHADQTISGITVSDSKLHELYNGVYLQGVGAGTSGYVGPEGFRVTQNCFDDIYAEGIEFDGAQNCMSGFNMFLDVATKFRGGNYPAADNFNIILINTDNNVSFGDMFERDNQADILKARIDITNKKVFALDAGERYKFGTYRQNAGDQVYLDITGSPTTIITISTAEAQAFSMQYQFRDDLNLTTRFGTLQVVAQDGDDSSGTLTYTDDYTENNPTDLVLSVSQSGTNIEIDYTLGGVADGGTLKYSINYLA